MADEDVNSGGATGTWGHGASGSFVDQIPIVDNEGNWFNIDPAHQQEAIEKGYRIPSPEEADRHDRLTGFLGNTAAAAGSALQGVTFGMSDPLLKKFAPGTYYTLKEAEAANPNFALGGTVAGLGASMAAPFMKAIGTIGQGAKTVAQAGLGTGALGTIAGRAAQGLAEGATVTAPGAITQSLTADDQADKDEAVETMIAGFGFGLALGGLAGVLEAGKPTIDKIGAYALRRTKEFEVSQRLKSAGMTKGLLKNIIKKPGGMDKAAELSDYWEQSPLSGILNTATDTKEAANTLLSEYGKEIGESLKEADKIVPEGVIDKTTLRSELNKIYKSIPEDDLVGNSAEKAASLTTINDFLKQTVKEIPEKTSPVIDQYGNKIITPGETKEFPLTFEKAQALKQSFNNLKTPTGNTPADRIFSRAAEAVSDAIENGMDSLVENKGIGAELKKTLDNARYHYRNLKGLEPSINNLVANLQNQTMSPSAWAAIIAGMRGAVDLATNVKTAGTLFILNTLRREYGGAAGAYAASRFAQVGNAVGAGIGKVAEAIVNDPYPKARIASTRLLAELTGKQDPTEATDHLVNQLSQVNNNPQLAAEQLGNATTELAQYKPDLAFLAQKKMGEVANYLVNEAPKKPEVSSPFQADTKYSDRDISQFERQVSVAMNPMSALQDMASGALDPASLKALKTLYPRLYNKMQQQILQTATKKKRTYNMTQKTNLSMFLEAPVDTILTPDKMQALQANFNKKMDAPKKSGKKVDFSDNYKTQNERIEAR